jgi:hypothetical protein
VEEGAFDPQDERCSVPFCRANSTEARPIRDLALLNISEDHSPAQVRETAAAALTLRRCTS